MVVGVRASGPRADKVSKFKDTASAHAEVLASNTLPGARLVQFNERPSRTATRLEHD